MSFGELSMDGIPKDLESFLQRVVKLQKNFFKKISSLLAKDESRIIHAGPIMQIQMKRKGKDRTYYANRRILNLIRLWSYSKGADILIADCSSME
jgi:hypothetical protein